MSKRRAWTLIVLTCAAAAGVCVLLTVSPVFSHVWDRELFPLGWVAGWLARGAVRKRRGAKIAR